MPSITSLQNPRIKRIVKLSDRRYRDEVGQTIVEGLREVGLALHAGPAPLEAYVCAERLAPEAHPLVRQLEKLAAARRTELFEVTPAVFEKIAYRGESGGLLLVIAYRSVELNELTADVPFLVIIEEAEKPGNLGAILRTADAAGVDAVIAPIAPGGRGTDLHNPNVIRASLGAYFTVPVVAAPATEIIEWLGERDIEIIAATPAAARLYTDVDLTGPVAIVMGSEAWGLSETWLAAADRPVRIPMAGQVDSLNLSAATALLLYEVVRQRRDTH